MLATYTKYESSKTLICALQDIESCESVPCMHCMSQAGNGSKMKLAVKQQIIFLILFTALEDLAIHANTSYAVPSK